MTQAVTDDPFGATVTDEDDPFAAPEDAKPGGGGNYTPSPSLEALDGRLIALIPRKFRDDAPIPERFQQPGGPKVRDQWTVDLALIGGGPFSFWANVKEQGSDQRTMTEIKVDMTEGSYLWQGVWIVQQAVIGQLNKVAGTTRPIVLGVVRRGPQAKDARDKGATFETIANEYKAWEARGRKGQEPRFSWQIDTEVSPELRAEAVAWWKANKEQIKL